jgi:hypothetical protein
VQISYAYLAVLLVFALLTGVVIGDRLAANTDGGNDGGRSGACSGLASAGLHNCVHRLGHLRGAPGKLGQRDVGCETEGINGGADD